MLTFFLNHREYIFICKFLKTTLDVKYSVFSQGTSIVSGVEFTVFASVHFRFMGIRTIIEKYKQQDLCPR